MWQDLIEALRFLTMVPMPSSDKRDPRALARSMFFFPFVGVLIALVTLAIYALLLPVLSERLAALVLLILPILLSGGMHLDGFTDFCDGFFSGKDREGVLAVMKDPRVGTWGVAGVCLLLLIKWELLAVLPAKHVIFLMALGFSRWAHVVLSFFLPGVGNRQGLGMQVAKNVKPRELIGATALLLPLIAIGGNIGWVLLFATVLFLALLGFCFYHRVGGITGDLLGAAGEMTEVLIFFIAIVLLHPSS